MNKHDEARKLKGNLVKVQDGGITYGGYGRKYNANDAIKDSQKLDEYFNEMEQLDKDVQRFVYLVNKKLKFDCEIDEMIDLEIKLSKVGNDK